MELKFNYILIVNFLDIQSKIRLDVRPWNEKTIKRAAVMKGGPHITGLNSQSAHW